MERRRVARFSSPSRAAQHRLPRGEASSPQRDEGGEDLLNGGKDRVRWRVGNRGGQVEHTFKLGGDIIASPGIWDVSESDLGGFGKSEPAAGKRVARRKCKGKWLVGILSSAPGHRGASDVAQGPLIVEDVDGHLCACGNVVRHE